MSSVSTLHVDPDQPNPRLYPDPNPDPNPEPFGELEVGRGSHTVPPLVLVAFFQYNTKSAVFMKDPPRPV